MQKVKTSFNMPEIIGIKDFQTLRENEVITRGGTAEIKGSDLKIDPDDAEQGIFIINDTQEIRVDTYLHNKPSHLIFLVPGNSPEGEVRIQIRNKQKGGSSNRIETFETNLTVV